MNLAYFSRETKEFFEEVPSFIPDNDYLRWYRYIHHSVAHKKENKKQTKFSISLNPKEINRLNARIDKMIQTFPYSQKYAVCQKTRWAIGVGGASPYGNLQILTLHPLYGVPYIPASTLKGLMRRCWIDINCDGNEKDDEMLRLFGSPSDETPSDEQVASGRFGKLVFFDSFPSAERIGMLVKDVFTPHYPQYYERLGCIPPTDDQNPVPVEFLCLDGFTFTIYIGAQTILTSDEEDKLKKAVNDLFSEHGIGAKTSLGYGRGQIVE